MKVGGGLQDERQHGRLGDKRKWLYAYAITSKGYQSLFPNADRDLKVKLSYDTAGQAVTLQAKGLPESAREHQMFECTISATNTSKKELAIEPGAWFALEVEKGGYFMSHRLPDKRTVLKPGESVSHVISLQLALNGDAKEIALHWKFVPKRSASGSP